jgi:cytochrome c oxidase subunit 2
VVFVVMLHDMAALSAAGRDPTLTVEVTGHDWWWEVRYPDRHVTTANEIHILVGQPVRLVLRSADVIHSFWVPQLAAKTDLIPGKTNVTWLQARVAGTYRGQCAEYCGLQHAHMALLVVADPPEAFAAWVRQQRATATAPGAPLAASGRAVFERSSCAACHSIGGTTARGTIGPNLTHLGSRHTIGAGTLPNTPDNLAAWITDPQAAKPGAAMPPQPLTPQELRALVAYLESRR